MQSSTCQLLTMTSSLLHTLRSSQPLPQHWTLPLYLRTRVIARSPLNGLNFRPLAALILFTVRTVALPPPPWAWQAIFRSLVSSTRLRQRPLRSFPSINKRLVTSRPPGLDAVHPPASQTASPASMLRARSQLPPTLQFHTLRPI